jgi:hypothetical protein
MQRKRDHLGNRRGLKIARRLLRRVWNLIESESSKLRVNFYTQATRFSLSPAAGPRFTGKVHKFDIGAEIE